MFRTMAIALSGAVLLAACGSDSAAQQGPPVPPVPPAYSPPANPQAPLPNPQQPGFNENAPPPNFQAPPANPQQPNIGGGALPPPNTGGGGTLPPELIQQCKLLCSTLFGECVEDCNEHCDDLSSISAECTVPAGFVVTCYAAGATCNDNGNIELPRRQCQDALVERQQVSEMCLDQLF